MKGIKKLFIYIYGKNFLSFRVLRHLFNKRRFGGEEFQRHYRDGTTYALLLVRIWSYMYILQFKRGKPSTKLRVAHFWLGLVGWLSFHAITNDESFNFSYPLVYEEFGFVFNNFARKRGHMHYTFQFLLPNTSAWGCDYQLFDISHIISSLYHHHSS